MRTLPREWLLPAALFGLALGSQLAITGYLLGSAAKHAGSELRQMQVQITQDLAGQLSRAQAANDDLSALAALRAARAHYPQMHEALLFDNSGRILLHTDGGMLGKQTAAPQGPRLTSPEVSAAADSGRPLTAVQVPVPDREDGYFRAVFDGTSRKHHLASLQVRFIVLILLGSIAPALVARWWLRRFELLDPLARAEASASLPPQALAAGLVQELLKHRPQATLVFSRDHRLLGANAAALKLLGCSLPDLEGKHFLAAPLPAPVSALYQQAIRDPAATAAAGLSLPDRTGTHPAQAQCIPPSDQWQFAELTIA